MTKKSNHILTMAAAALMLLGAGSAEAHNNRKENVRVGECREYVQDVWSYGRKKVASGVACYRGRGHWEVVSSNIGARHYHVAGPITILPVKQGKGHGNHGYHTYKTKQQVIIKPNHQKGWAYQKPVHQKKYKKKQNNYHGLHRDDDGITIEFKW